MKKVLRCVLFICAVGMIAMFGYTVVDMEVQARLIADQPGVSGVDFLMFNFGYGLVCFMYSVFGLISSAVNYFINRKEGGSRLFKIVSAVLSAVFVVLIAVSVVIAYS